jgi:CBS domain-containing protein
MRVKDVMTRNVISVSPQATVADALDLMLGWRLSGMPVIDAKGSLVGVVSEGDFLRRAELGTQKPERRWLDFLLPAHAAETYAHTHGRRVEEIMSSEPITIGEEASLEEAAALMETHRVKRLPVVAGTKVIGLITRADFVRLLAEHIRQFKGAPAASDAEIERRIKADLTAQRWAPIASIDADVKDGIVTLHGVIVDERQRNAIRAVAENVAGVRTVHDHIIWTEPYSGLVLLSPEEGGDKRVA